MGNRITNIKITVTQDEVDSGSRRIVEEVQLNKYHDFEQFSFQNIVDKMRQKLDPEIFLRIHVINNFTFDDEIFDRGDAPDKEAQEDDDMFTLRGSKSGHDKSQKSLPDKSVGEAPDKSLTNDLSSATELTAEKGKASQAYRLTKG